MILHWLGEEFDPALRGYWGAADFAAAAGHRPRADRRAAGRVDGIKLSVLDAAPRWRCGGGCPPGSGCTPATTSTTPTLIKGDATGTATRCWASSPRSPRPPRRRCTRSTPATWTATTRRSAPPCRSSRHDLRAAHLLLQGRRRLPGLAERPAAALRHAGRLPGGSGRPATWSRSSSWPPRPGASSTRAWPPTG